MHYALYYYFIRWCEENKICPIRQQLNNTNKIFKGQYRLSFGEVPDLGYYFFIIII